MNKLLKTIRLYNADAGGNSGGGGSADGGQGGSDGGSSTTILESSKGGTGSWLDSIADADLKAHPSLKDFKDVTGLAKSYVNQAQLIGRQRLELPNEKWGEKEWSDFYTKIGRPEKADGYKMERPQLPEGMTYDEKLEKSFLETAHKAGLTPKQVAALSEFYNVNNIQSFKGIEADRVQKMQTAEGELRKEYGDKYDSQIATAKMAAQNIGGDKLIDKLKQSGLANDPDMIKFLAHVGSFMHEDKAGSASNRGFVSNPIDAAAEIAQLRADPEFLKSYNDPAHPGYKLARERMERLYTTKNKGS